MDILQLKLKRDLLKLSLDYVTESTMDKDEFTKVEFTKVEFTKVEFTNWIQPKIDSYVDKKKMSFTVDTKVNETTCCARLWNNGQGEKQCTHKRVNGFYCDKHNRMLKYDGVLRFGDMREDKPTYDLIKLKNGQTERLHWLDPDPLKQLEHVLNLQKRKVILTTPKLILS